MNIACFITYYDPYVSGLSICAKRLAELLHTRGHSVHVVCMQHHRNLPVRQTISGVDVVRAKPLFRFSKGFFSIDFLEKSWSAVRTSDVVLIHLPEAEGWIIALLAKLFHKRVVSLYHCEVILPKRGINAVIQWLLEFTHTMTLRLSDAIVSYTDDYATHSRILRPFLSKTHAIYPPVPTPQNNVRVMKRLTATLGKHTLIIGISARLAAEKGIEYVLAALPSLPKDTVIAIAGPLEPVGETAYKEKIATLVSQFTHQVIFLGTLSQREIGAFYSLITVLVLPSINSTEAFGLVQVEAMLCGIPVIASDLPGVREPIRKTGMGIIVPKQDTPALSRAILEVHRHRARYIRPSSAISSVFSLDKTIDLYEQVLGL